MDHAEGHAACGAAVDDLEQAARIASGDDGRAGGGDVVDLSLEKFPGHLGLGDVVDARAAAAPTCLWQLDQFQAGDLFEQIPRLLGDFLTVAKVATLVVGGDLCGGGGFLRGFDLDAPEEFVDVLDLGIPLVSQGKITRIVGKEFGVMFEVGSAATGVSDDGVVLGGWKLIDVAASQFLGESPFAVVCVKGSAATLRWWTVDFASIASEDLDGVQIDVTEDQILGATG